ncbi:MAG: CHAP domain-containing protein [Myxococcota bacterium]
MSPLKIGGSGSYILGGFSGRRPRSRAGGAGYRQSTSVGGRTTRGPLSWCVHAECVPDPGDRRRLRPEGPAGAGPARGGRLRPDADRRSAGRAAARAVDRVPPTAESIATAARHYLDHNPRGFRDDCSGYVMAVFARAGIPLDGNTASFYDQAKTDGSLHHRKLPNPGDIAFFDDTYDRNHNGKLDDPLSHVAVVLEVHPDGTIVLGHGGTSRGRTTLTMNLEHPHDREGDDGAVVNDWLRVRRDDDPAGTRYLASELWRAFARFPARPLGAGLSDRPASVGGVADDALVEP